MSRRHLLAATLALVLALVAGTILVSRLSTSVREADTPPARRGGQPPTIGVTANMLQHGQVLYRDHCSSCHGSNGQADGPLSGSMSPNPRDQTSRAIMDRLPDTEIARRVQTGVGQMPANPQLRCEDLVALVAFVRSLSRPDVRVVELQALAQGTVADFVPVTAEMLRTPAADDWVMMRRTYDSWAFSPLDRINRGNVSRLQLAWARAMEPGGQYTTPLVHGGVMYLPHPGDVIQALNARTGDIIWEFRYERRAAPAVAGSPAPRPGRSTRNLAIYGTSLFHVTGDARILAIDARTGQLVWEVEEQPRRGIGHMAGPFIADGKVITGRSCSAVGGPEACFLAAHDPETGEELWRTHTIPRPGEPGDETWAGLPYERRWHVGTWGGGSYDPELNLIYWGTSVPAPSLEQVRGTPGGDALYSNATLAIDGATGRIVWHYQHLPRDNWDLDHVFERYLVDIEVAPEPGEVAWINPRLRPGERRRVVTGIPGKTGIVYTLDRVTGEFLWARETIHQNVVRTIDPDSGRVNINEDLIVAPFIEQLVCPSLGGGKNWPAGAYSPLTQLMYQPQQNMCMLLTGNTERPAPEDGYATDWVIVPDPREPNSIGRVDAVSIASGRTAWLHQQRAGTIGSLVATAGGLVFGGDVDRRFRAFDDATGAILWETILSAPASAHPVSYGVDGDQYIAVPVGGNTASPERRVLSLHPELKPPHGVNTLFVFTLPPDLRTARPGPDRTGSAGSRR